MRGVVKADPDRFDPVRQTLKLSIFVNRDYSYLIAASRKSCHEVHGVALSVVILLSATRKTVNGLGIIAELDDK